MYLERVSRTMVYDWAMSGHTYETTIVISASSSRVWEILSNVEAWPSWTPTMTSVKGVDRSALEWGAKFDVRQPGLMKATYMVTDVHPGRSFTWYNAVMGITLLANHELLETSDGKTTVKLSFEMSGLFAFMVWPLVKKKIRQFVNQEAESLKAVCE